MFNKGVVKCLSKILMARLILKLILYLDKHVISLILNYGNQSEHNFPNIKILNQGVSSSSKLRNDQYIACVLVIYLVFLTPDFEKLVIQKRVKKIMKI